MELSEYKPVESSKGFYLSYRDNQPHCLYFQDKKKNSFQVEIKPNGYIPKSGVFFAQSIHDLIGNKSILDIGTGETGFISIFCSKNGAKAVTGVDIDKDAIAWARHNGELNKIQNSSWISGDTYENVTGKFDIILSNPPQLPMEAGNLHDSGGKDGREVIERIIVGAKNHLKPEGMVLLLIFDFLSVDKRYGSGKTIFEILAENNFKPSIIAEIAKLVRPEGKTYESLKSVKRIYPKYEFTKDEDGNLYYKMLIVKGELIS